MKKEDEISFFSKRIVYFQSKYSQLTKTYVREKTINSLYIAFLKQFCLIKFFLKRIDLTKNIALSF